MVRELELYKCIVDVYDPLVYSNSAEKEYGIKIIEDKNRIMNDYYDSALIAVAHNSFREMGSSQIKKFCKSNNILYDIKSIFPTEEVDLQL